MKLTPMQRLVFKVINLNPGVQNSDATLIAAVWRYEGWSDNLSLETNISRVTRSETITRRKRELYNFGLIEYSEERLREAEKAFKNELDSHSRAFDNMFSNPIEQFDKLTIKPSADDHTAVSWLND